MNKEKWLVWKPMEDIPNKLYLEELVDNYNGLTIKLSEGKNSSCLVIHFEVYRSFRSTDEGDLLRTLQEIENKEVLGTSTFSRSKNHFQVTRSPFLLIFLTDAIAFLLCFFSCAIALLII